MKKTIFKFVTFLFALGLSAMGVACSTTNGENGAQLNGELKPSAQACVATVQGEMPEKFAYGVEFNIPSATINYKGVEVSATESVLVYPDGKSTSEKNAILTMSGEYTIVYYVVVDGVTVSGEKTFSVAAEFEEDETPPIITFDGGFKKETVAWVALNERVVIPEAIIIDENFSGKSSVFVYYNYGFAQQTQVGVTDGAFTPNLEGEYVIVYLAKDSFGNQTKVERSVLVSRVEGNKAVSINVGETEKAVAGTNVTVPDTTIDGLYNDLERMNAYVQFGNEEKIQVQGGRFFATHVGDYQVTYEYKTPVAVYEKTITLSVVSENVVIFDDYATPDYFIKNAKYSLDEIYVTAYNQENPVRSASKTYLKQDDGAYAEVDVENFEITANSTVRFKFETDGAVNETPVFKVIDVGFGEDLKTEEFFVGDVTKVATEDDGVIVKMTKSATETKVSFVNVISLSTFKFLFNIPTSSSTIGSITLRLTDYYDRANFVDVRYVNEGGTATFTMGDARAVSLSRNFFGTKHNIYFEPNTSLFYDYGSGVSLAFENTFTSDRILFEIIVENHSSDASIIIEKFGDQSFKQGAVDRTLPTLYIENIQQGSWGLNEEIVLEQAIVTDVLTPYLKENSTFSVKMPDKSWAKAKDGTVLDGTCEVEKDYVLALSQYGTYEVVYSYVDQNGKRNSISYPIFVYDRNSPTITLEGVKEGDTVRVKAGETVQIASFTVSDGKTPTEELKTYVAVYNPNGAYLSGAMNSFTTNHKGKYRIVYYCQDADGNYTTVTYTVIAE